MLKLFLWLKYLGKRKIVILSILAVALSAALLIVVNSLFTGYIDMTEDYLTSAEGDLNLLVYADINDHRKITSNLEELEIVKSAVPSSRHAGLVWLGKGKVRESFVKGIDPAKEMKFRQLDDFFVFGDEPKDPDLDKNSAWLGIAVSGDPNQITDEYDLDELKELLGENILLTVPDIRGKRKTVKLKVNNFVKTRSIETDRSIFIPIEKMHEVFFDVKDDFLPYFFVQIRLKKGVSPKEAKGVVLKRYRQFAAMELGLPENQIYSVRIGAERPGREIYLGELHKQMNMLLLIFGVICSTSVLLIFCIFYMIVISRLKDVAIIKSCGAGGLSVAGIYTGFGVFIGVVGSILGVVFGYFTTVNMEYIDKLVGVIFGFKLWRASSYKFYQIPDTMNWGCVWWIVLLAIGGCLLGSLIPAIKAAMTSPVKMLRYE